MKKLITLLTVTSVIGSTLLSSNSALKMISGSTYSANKKYNNNTLFPFINRMSSIDKNEKIKDVVVSDNSTVYASSATNLFKSDDGVNFKHTFSGQITSIAVKEKQLYLGTSYHLLTSDDGVNFIEASKDLVNTTILKIVVAKNGTLYVATGRGLYQSLDGIKFTKISDYIVKDMTISDTGSIYIIHDDQLDKSIDGKTWEHIFNTGKDNISSLALGPKGQVYLVINSLENDYLYTSNDDKTFTKIDLSLGIIHKIAISSINAVILATDKGLYESLYGTTFSLLTPFFNKPIFSFSLDLNRRVFISVPNQGLFEINLLKNLLSVNQPDYDSAQYDDALIYNTKQFISFKSFYLTKALWDKTDLDIRTRNLPLKTGRHTLDLTINDSYKKYLTLFGADPNKGVITYNFEIKNNIDNDIVQYHPANSTTKVITGLVSNAGNTNGCDIIQTKVDPNFGDHPAALEININNKKNDMIDYANSYYIAGTVNTVTNDFNNSGIIIPITKDFTIKNDGIYHFHLVDLVGNSYDSYLELGLKNNNQLRGDMTDNQVSALAKKLNVTVSVVNPEDKQTIMTWLQTYQAAADQAFNNAVASYGKEFDIKISDLLNGYKDFLDPVTYINPQTQYLINQDKLKTLIYNIGNNDLNTALANLHSELYNVDTSNVADKNTLDSYTTWFNNYQKYLKDNKSILINNITHISTRGFGTSQQIDSIKRALTTIKTFNKDYLNNIVWNNNFSNTNFNYSKLIKKTALQNYAINYTNTIYPEINKLYQDYLSNAESHVSMYGYTLKKLLGNNPLPQTKDQIDNYIDGKSFTQWLQETVNSKYHQWQLIMGLSLGIPLFFIVSLSSLYYYWKYNIKYNPKEYKMYKRLQKIDQQRFKQKKNKKKKPFLD